MTVTRLFTGNRLKDGKKIQFKLGTELQLIKQFGKKANVLYQDEVITVEVEMMRKCTN